MKVFGTDGIRGKANVWPMTPEVALRVGKAVALFFREKNGKQKHRVVIGKDTRLSGYMLETALTSGIVSMGVDVLLVGPMPTPAISHLTKSMNCDAGIVISASHNPAEDNGIKLFDSNGFKLNEQTEQEIEKLILSKELNSDSGEIGKATRIDDAKGRYIGFIKDSIDNLPLNGLKIVIDCANGAGYHIAPDVFSELGAETIVLNNKPNGKNINLNCGAMHPEVIMNAVKEHGADFGVALDGDADRLIVCDEKSNLVDGDAILAVFARDLKEKGKLESGKVAGTVMSNLGLIKALEKMGLELIPAKVGDKFVIEEMRKQELELGGEQSGHIIFREFSSTGDGILCAVQLARIAKQSGKKLSDIAVLVEKFPQKLVNIEVKEKKPLMGISSVKQVIEAAERKLEGKGRILVRYSGTENKVRVMVEAETADLLSLTDKVAGVIESELGK